MESENTTAQIAELKERIADLYSRLPKHSIPPAMLIELEELEEELERATQEDQR
ncbi:MAG: histidine kinase [Chloroflexota bacterium]|nr:histidine kinase [Chloroflexota bacterium]